MTDSREATGGRMVPVVQQGLGRLALAASGGRVLRRDERGMVSAEWAVGIIAAIAIAGVLLAVVTNGKVEDALLDFILMVIDAFARGL